MHSSSSLVLLLRDRGELGYSHRVDGLPFAHEILSLHDHAAAVGKAGDPHEALLVLDDADRNELDRVVGVDGAQAEIAGGGKGEDRKSTRLNSSHLVISYAVFCLKKKNIV